MSDEPTESVDDLPLESDTAGPKETANAEDLVEMKYHDDEYVKSDNVVSGHSEAVAEIATFDQATNDATDSQTSDADKQNMEEVGADLMINKNSSGSAKETDIITADITSDKSDKTKPFSSLSVSTKKSFVDNKRNEISTVSATAAVSQEDTDDSLFRMDSEDDILSGVQPTSVKKISPEITIIGSQTTSSSKSNSSTKDPTTPTATTQSSKMQSNSSAKEVNPVSLSQKVVSDNNGTNNGTNSNDNTSTSPRINTIPLANVSTAPPNVTTTNHEIIRSMVDEAEGIAMRAKEQELEQSAAQKEETKAKLEARKRNKAAALNSRNAKQPTAASDGISGGSGGGKDTKGSEDQGDSLFDVDFNEGNNENNEASATVAPFQPKPPSSDGGSHKSVPNLRKKSVRLVEPTSAADDSENMDVPNRESKLPKIKVPTKKRPHGVDHTAASALTSADDNTPSGSGALIGVLTGIPSGNRIKLPELNHHSVLAGDSNSEKRSVSERTERDRERDREANRDPNKKRRPLYLRMIAKAHRKIQDEERKKFEAYNLLKQNKAKNNPSRAEIKQHMKQYDEIMRQKGDEGKQTIANNIKPFKKTKGDKGKDVDSELSQMDSENAEKNERKVVNSSPSKLKYNPASGSSSNAVSKLRAKVRVEDEIDAIEGDERRERLRKQKEISEKIREDLHTKSPTKSPKRDRSTVSHKDSEDYSEETGADEGERPVIKLSPRTRNKGKQNSSGSITGGRSKQNSSSSVLKDLDGNPVISGDDMAVGYNSSMFSQDEARDIPGDLDSATLASYCAPDWIDKMKQSDESNSVLKDNIDSELSRMLANV